MTRDTRNLLLLAAAIGAATGTAATLATLYVVLMGLR